MCLSDEQARQIAERHDVGCECAACVTCCKNTHYGQGLPHEELASDEDLLAD